eukprot:TRINITY_DN5449_c0_g3_i3.p2 TRINITY_DN5449_c0_g3~~TRINITY_DN5449_c0_g3_i3.p2  ORF type:complete len:194 (+),score=11.89 TRINITY_DN5449_c0_g3_i3:146-727(+)
MSMSLLCCFGICSTLQRIRYQRNSSQQRSTLEETELSELQNDKNVQEIMSQLKHSKYQPKSKNRDIENQISSANRNITDEQNLNLNQAQSLNENKNLSLNLGEDLEDTSSSDVHQKIGSSQAVNCSSDSGGCEDEEDTPICAICYDGYVEDQDVTHLTCGHMYHMLCIERWIKFKVFYSSCPLCSQKLVETLS